MAKIRVQGIDTFNTQLEKYASEIHRINRGTVGEGAKILADGIKEGLNSMPVRKAGRPKKGQKLIGATSSEKEQIIANFGIKRFEENADKISTSIGFTGYVKTYSHRFNDNVPTGMLMQVIEYGSEERTGTHTVQNAANKVKSTVESSMQEYMDREVSKIIK